MSDRGEAVKQAFSFREENERFDREWPRLTDGAPMPTFTWEALERQLLSLSANNQSAALAAGLVSATRKLAPWKPPEFVLREILCLASTLMDRDFPPSAEEGDSMS